MSLAIILSLALGCQLTLPAKDSMRFNFTFYTLHSQPFPRLCTPLGQWKHFFHLCPIAERNLTSPLREALIMKVFCKQYGASYLLNQRRWSAGNALDNCNREPMELLHV